MPVTVLCCRDPATKQGCAYTIPQLLHDYETDLYEYAEFVLPDQYAEFAAWLPHGVTMSTWHFQEMVALKTQWNTNK